MMRGIRLNHGVSFVEIDGITIRIGKDGKCELSRILLPSLEWDLRTEPPETWDYIGESEIASLGENTLKQIEAIVAKFRNTIE